MAKDLTTLQLDRQNILNNDLAMGEIQKQTGLQGLDDNVSVMLVILTIVYI